MKLESALLTVISSILELDEECIGVTVLLFSNLPQKYKKTTRFTCEFVFQICAFPSSKNGNQFGPLKVEKNILLHL